MIIELYKKNKPLIHSILTGAFYLLFWWSLDFGDDTKMLFMILMMFLPGLTFPITTTYYNLKDDGSRDLRVTGHIILSVLIYHGSVWVFSAEGRIEYMTIVAGLSGSLFYLLATKYLLKKNLTYFQITLTSILSGLAFVPCVIKGIGGSAIIYGLSIFMWTIINGQLMNMEYRSHHR